MGTRIPPTTVAHLLQRYRRAAGLTQEELAERAHLSVQGISNLERGVRRHPQRGTVTLLIEALSLKEAERAEFEAAARGLAEPAADRAPLTVPTDLPLMLGRERELDLLGGHLRGEGPPALFLAGEPGIGKSRLLAEAIRCGGAAGWCVLHGTCTRSGGELPYAPLLQALQRHIRGLSAAQQRSALRGCAWLVRLLPELADGPIEPLPQWTLSPEQERR